MTYQSTTHSATNSLLRDYSYLLMSYATFAIIVGVILFGMTCVQYLTASYGLGQAFAGLAFVFAVIFAAIYLTPAIYFILRGLKMKRQTLSPNQFRSTTTSIIVWMIIQGLFTLALLPTFLSWASSGETASINGVILSLILIILFFAQICLFVGAIVLKRYFLRRTNQPAPLTAPIVLTKIYAWTFMAYAGLITFTSILAMFDLIYVANVEFRNLFLFTSISTISTTVRLTFSFFLLAAGAYFLYFCWSILPGHKQPKSIRFLTNFSIIMLGLQLIFTIFGLKTFLVWLPQGAIIFLAILQSVLMAATIIYRTKLPKK